ncbi:MAG: LexA family protein [Candidatus Cryptobacteroides sp.]
MKKENKGGRGGKRPGAGRPKVNGRMITFRCSGEMAKRLDEMPNRTGFIKQSLQKALFENDVGLVPAWRVKPMKVPFFSENRVVAGFPIPLDNDENAQDIELLSLLCPHPESSYLIRVQGDSMIDAGLLSGDIVIVDKSNRNPSPKEIAMCELNGEYTLKHFVREEGKAWLVPANPEFMRKEIREEDDFSVWGTVTYIIHKAR